MKHLNLIILFIFISLNIFAEEREKTIVKNIQIEGISGIQGFSYYDTNGNLDTVYAVLDTTKLNREQLIEFIQNNGLTLIELGFVDANYLHTTGNETATGQKTISTLLSDDYETTTNTSKFGRSVGNGDLITLKDETKTGQILLRSFGNSEFRNGNFIIGGSGVDHGEKLQSYGSIWSNSTIQGTRFISSIATGTAPLTVNSTTEVSNLNSNYLQGKTWADVKSEISDSIQSIIISIVGDTIFLSNGTYAILPDSIIYSSELLDSMIQLRSEMSTDSPLFALINDTIKPKQYPIRIDTFTMGDVTDILPNYIYYQDGYFYYYDDTESVTALASNVRLVAISENAEIQYRGLIYTDYNIVQKSIDFGITWTTVDSILTPNSNDDLWTLKCSFDGRTLAYTAGDSMYVSTDYGEIINRSYAGTVDNTGYFDASISPNGNIVAFGDYNDKKLYYYRYSFSTAHTLSTTFPRNIVIDNDSTIYYHDDSANAYYKYTPDGTNTLKVSSISDTNGALGGENICFKIDNSTLYYLQNNTLKKTTDDFATSTTIYTGSADFRTFEVSDLASYIYIIESSTEVILVSSDFGSSFTTYASSPANSFFQGIVVNAGLYSPRINVSYKDGRMVFDTGGITFKGFQPKYPGDLITLAFLQSLNLISGDLGANYVTEVLPGSLLDGGGVGGSILLDVDLTEATVNNTINGNTYVYHGGNNKFQLDYLIPSQTALSSGLASTDEFLISDNGLLKRMDVAVLQSYMQNNLSFSSGGTGTSLSGELLYNNSNSVDGTSKISISPTENGLIIFNDNGGNEPLVQDYAIYQSYETTGAYTTKTGHFSDIKSLRWIGNTTGGVLASTSFDVPDSCIVTGHVETTFYNSTQKKYKYQNTYFKITESSTLIDTVHVEQYGDTEINGCDLWIVSDNSNSFGIKYNIDAILSTDTTYISTYIKGTILKYNY